MNTLTPLQVIDDYEGKEARQMLRHALLVVMAKYSEEHYSAGWMSGLDQIIQEAANEDAAAIRWLADVAGGWWRWTDAQAQDGPEFVPKVLP